MMMMREEWYVDSIGLRISLFTTCLMVWKGSIAFATTVGASRSDVVRHGRDLL